MTIAIANVDVTTDTFSVLVARTNQVAEAISRHVVTIDNSAGGNTSVGNGHVFGVFGSDIAFAAQELRGGNTSTSANLIISSITKTYANLHVNGSIISTGNFSLTGAATLSNTVTIIGASSVANTLSVVGNTSFSNSLVVTGNTALANSLVVTGNAQFSNNLTVTGITSIANTLTITGSSTLANTLSVVGNTSLANSLVVTGNTNLSNTLIVTGNTTLSKLNVTGNTDIIGNTNLGSTLIVTGNTTLSRLNVTGNATFSNNLTVTGNTTLGYTSVSGDTIHINLYGTDDRDAFIDFHSSGNTSFPVYGASVGKYSGSNGNFEIIDMGSGNFILRSQEGIIKFLTGSTTRMSVVSNGNIGISTESPIYKLDVNGTLRSIGNVTFSSQLNVTGNTTINGNTNLSNTLIVTGNTTLSKLNVTGNTDIIGNTNLGSTLIVTGNTTLSRLNVTGNTDIIGNTNLGSTLIVTGNTTLSRLTVSGNTDIIGNTNLGSTLIVTGNTTLSRLTVSGNTDIIGNTNLGSTLNVTGDIRASANVYGTLATVSQPYITSNNTNYLNGQPSSYYTNATNIITGTINTARISGDYNNITSVGILTNLFVTGNTTINVNSSDVALKINQIGTGHALYVEDTVSPDPTPTVITNNGVLIAGSNSQVTVGSTAKIQVISTDSGSHYLAAGYANISNQGARITFYKSRSVNTELYSAVANGDQIARLDFFADDGGQPIEASRIMVMNNGTPGPNSMPTSMYFYVTGEGSNSALTGGPKLAIFANGNIGIGTVSSVNAKLNLQGTANVSGNVTMLGQLNVAGNTTIDGGTFILDSALNTVGIGAATPNTRLSVSGPLALYPPTKVTTVAYAVTVNDSSLIIDTVANCNVIMPTAATYPGRILYIKNIAARSVNSTSANIKPIDSNTSANSILTNTAGKFAMLQSDGADWVIMMNN